MASDVFKVRFDGLEWWARDAFEEMAPDYQRVLLWPLVAGAPPEKHVGPSLTVPAHMVVRVEDIPPEPTEPGTVVYDRDDVAWQRGPAGWYGADCSGVTVRSGWRDLRHPPHPYPRAARAEIERLTAERDEATAEVTAESTRFAEVERLLRVAQENAESRLQSAMAATGRADKEKARADELQRRIDRALEHLGPIRPSAYSWINAGPLRRILRGKVDQ